MKITVTKEHINNGELCSSDKCPLALALQDAGFENAFVGGGYLYFDSQCPDRYLPMGWELYDFVRDFDSRKPVAPFSFELKNIPPEKHSLLQQIHKKTASIVRRLRKSCRRQ